MVGSCTVCLGLSGSGSRGTLWSERRVELLDVEARQSRWCPARIVVVSKVMVWQSRWVKSLFG